MLWLVHGRAVSGALDAAHTETGGADPEEPVDDAGLFCGWDGLSVDERRQRLALYQRRVRARIAEQERAWLQARLREYAKG
ncbi:hypothetical protein ACFS3C_05405 [Azotobacter vinelandii]